MENNFYWRELIEREIKVLNKLVEIPCNQELIEELRNLYGKLEDKPHSRELIEGLINYYNKTEGNSFRLELMEALINIYDEWEENPYKQELIERITNFYCMTKGKLSEQELIDGLVNLYGNWANNPYIQDFVERLSNLSDKRDDKPRWHEFIERARNSHGDYESFLERVKENESLFAKLQGISEQLEIDIDNFRGRGQKQILKMIFNRVYNFIVRSNDSFIVFGNESRLHTNVFESCFFTSLCLFINDTKRIKGMSLREFIYYNDQIYGFCDRNSKYYFDLKKRKVPGGYDKIKSPGNDKIEDEVTRLRQSRRRLLTTRDVYNKRNEWTAIRRSSEHEWSFLYALLKIDADLLQTYTDIGNLYKVINAKLNSPKDDGYKDRVEAGYKHFKNKLKKIKYEKYLALQREILRHISEDKKYYGMNIYRFEKRLRLYNITSEVNRLLKCKDEEEECSIIKKSIILNEVHFPKVYQDFSSFDNLTYTAFCADTYYRFRNTVVGASRLIYDSLIDSGYLEDWESFFLDTINGLTEKIFYEPENLDYTVAPKSQEKFTELISAPVRIMLL